MKLYQRTLKSEHPTQWMVSCSLTVFTDNLQKYFRENKQNQIASIWCRNTLVRSHFKIEIAHVCGKPLKVQETAAQSPPTFMQIFAWNLIDSISAGSALRSWNYSLICFFSFAAAASLKSVASALSWSKFFYQANHHYFRKIKWKLSKKCKMVSVFTSGYVPCWNQISCEHL